jgi:hypothetical protein
MTSVRELNCYTVQPRGLRLQRHKREAIDGHSNKTKRTDPRGTPTSIPCGRDKKHKITRNIQAEWL